MGEEVVVEVVVVEGGEAGGPVGEGLGVGYGVGAVGGGWVVVGGMRGSGGVEVWRRGGLLGEGVGWEVEFAG